MTQNKYTSMRYIFHCSFFIFIVCFFQNCINEENQNQSEEEQDIEVENSISEIDSIDVFSSDSLENYWSKAELVDTFNLKKNSEGYSIITWKHLSHVKFNEIYTEEVEAYVPYPVFHPSIQKLQRKKVIIEGYIIPIEETGDETLLVLSAFPFSACFFCGLAGPETIMDIQLKDKLKKSLKQDEVVSFKGRLRLNDSDLYYLNYILEDAVLED